MSTKIYAIENVISRPLIDSNINPDEFFSLDNVLEEYDDMKEEIRNSSHVKWIFIALNF